jgi:hypothetical protein
LEWEVRFQEEYQKEYAEVEVGDALVWWKSDKARKNNVIEQKEGLGPIVNRIIQSRISGGKQGECLAVGWMTLMAQPWLSGWVQLSFTMEEVQLVWAESQWCKAFRVCAMIVEGGHVMVEDKEKQRKKDLACDLKFGACDYGHIGSSFYYIFLKAPPKDHPDEGWYHTPQLGDQLNTTKNDNMYNYLTVGGSAWDTVNVDWNMYARCGDITNVVYLIHSYA